MTGVKKLGIFSIFLLLFSIASVYALQENFDVSTTQNIAACSYSVTTNSIVIRNTGDIESAYSLSSSGNTDFATYSENSFTLKAGESKTIFVYLSPGSKTGNYDLQTTVKTNFGLTKTVDSSITAEKCQNIQLIPKTSSIKVNPCQVSQFSFDVRNTGSYAELYDFNVKGLEGFTTLSANELLIQPGETKQVDVFVNPECGIYGTKELKFQALTKTTQYLAETNVFLDILRNYDYSVSVSTPANICNLKLTAIPVYVKNNVGFVNQYDISLRGPDWLRQEAGRVELGPFGSGTTNIYAYAENPGKYSADVKFNSVRGNIAKEGSFDINVNNCYQPSVNIDKPSDIIIAGHKSQYKIDVKNEGTKTDNYIFELDAPEWVSSNAQKIKLNPKETRSFNLTAMPVNVTGDFTATFKIISAETNSTKEDKIMLKVVSPEDAYSLNINPQSTRILYGQNVIKVDLENKGVLPAAYDLSLGGPSWTKLTSNSVTLKPGEKAQAYIQTNAGAKEQEADYEVQFVAKVKGESVGYSSKFIIKLRKLTLGQEIQVFTTKYLYFVIAGAVLMLVLVFIAIFGRRIARRWRNWRTRRKELAKIRKELKARKKEEKLARKLQKKAEKAARPPRKIWRKIFGILMIVIALGLLTTGVVYVSGYVPIIHEIFKQKESNKFDSIIKVDTTDLEAYGNTVIIRGIQTKIPIIVKNNLNRTLVFDVQVDQDWIKTDTKQIELQPKSQEVIKLTVTPKDGVKGIYKIGISASLQDSNKVMKEDITLNVRQQSLLQDLLDYVWYFVSGVAVLIIVLILRLISRRKKNKSEKVEKHSGFSQLKHNQIKKVNIEIPKRK